MENCSQPLMASTMFDVPALDESNFGSFNWVADTKPPIRAGSVNRQCS